MNISTIRAGCTASYGGRSHSISLEKRVIQLTTVEAIFFWAVNDLNLKESYSRRKEKDGKTKAVTDLNLKGLYSTQRSALFQKCAVMILI